MKVKPLRKYVVPAALALALPAVAAAGPKGICPLGGEPSTGQQIFAKGGTSWYLPESLVVSTVGEMFKEAGYEMKQRVTYDSDGVAFKIDLWDESAGVGFEFLHEGDFSTSTKDDPQRLNKRETKTLAVDLARRDRAVLVLHGRDKRFRKLENVVQAVEEFLEHVENDETV